MSAGDDRPVNEHKLTVGGRTLAIMQGDITRVSDDAIVNAANESLAGGGGVDGAIHRAGGPAIMADLTARYGPLGTRHCPTGSAVITTAGNLPAHWVIHAVGPIWRGGGRGEAELLASAHATSLRLAIEVGATSITFPAISCGVYGYPLELAAPIALATVRDALLDRESTIERAMFVLFSSGTLDGFRAALDSLRGG
jgi:O-acetyl-ADP-ribose deacetylase (regulator of RNase III)